MFWFLYTFRAKIVPCLLAFSAVLGVRCCSGFLSCYGGAGSLLLAAPAAAEHRL